MDELNELDKLDEMDELNEFDEWMNWINQSINIFRGVAQDINGFIQMIISVCPRAQGAQESQEFSPWR